MGPESRSVFGPEGGAWLNSREGFSDPPVREPGNF